MESNSCSGIGSSETDKRISKHKVGDVIWYDCSHNAGLCKVYKIEWWEQPAPELFGNDKLPWYFIRNIDTGHTNEEFESCLLKDKLGTLLYG